MMIRKMMQKPGIRGKQEKRLPRNKEMVPISVHLCLVIDAHQTLECHHIQSLPSIMMQWIVEILEENDWWLCHQQAKSLCKKLASVLQKPHTT
jgi:uncharacterized protein (UPF0276 family)